jgi:hypothetical protein
LFPDEWIGRDCKKVGPIFLSQWPELEKRPFQGWL